MKCRSHRPTVSIRSHTMSAQTINTIMIYVNDTVLGLLSVEILSKITGLWDEALIDLQLQWGSKSVSLYN